VAGFWTGVGALAALAASLLVAFARRRRGAASSRAVAPASGGRRASAASSTPAAAASSRRELQALYDAAVAVGSGTELESTATQTLDVICTVARIDLGMVYRVDRTSGRLALVAHYGIPPRYMDFLTTREIERTRIGQTARTGEHTVVDLDPARIKDPTLKEAVASEGYRTQLSLPIPVQGATWGVMALVSREQRRFDADELTLLNAAAHQVGLAVGRAALFAELRRKSHRLEILTRVAQGLAATLPGEEMLQRVAEAAREMFDAAVARVWLVDDDGETLSVRVSSGLEVSGGVDRLRVGEGFVGRVAATRAPLTIPDLASDSLPLNTQRLRARGLAAFAGVPLLIGERVLGVLAIGLTERHEYSAEELDVFTSLANSAAVALENARLFSIERARRQQIAALADIERELAAVLDAERLPALIVERATGLFKASGALWTLDDDRGLVPRAWRGQELAGQRLAPGEGFAGLAISERRGIITNDYARSPHAAPRFVAAGVRSVIVQPLILRDRPLGVLTMSRAGAEAAPFGVEDLALLQSFAAHAATALENTRLYAEAQERLRETSTLLAVGRVLSQPDAGRDAMRRVAAEVARAFGADMVGAYLLDERKERLIAAGGYHVPKDLLPFFQQRPLVLGDFPWLLESWRQGRAAWSSDVPNDPRFDRGWVENLPAHSVLFVPTLARGEPVGGLFLVWWHAGRTFERAEIRLVEGVAAQVGLAAENADLARQTQVKLAETQTLLSVSRALSSTLDFQALLRHFLRAVATTLGADCVGSWLVQEDGEWLEPAAGYRVPPERLAVFREFRVSLLKHPFYAQAARTRRPVFTSDAMHDSRIPATIREQGPHRSQLFVPVVVKDRMIGAFAAVWWQTPREFSEGEIALMEAIANQAGVALENGRLFEENRQRLEELLVLHDLSRAVTGQLERGAIVDAVHRHIARVLDARNLVVIVRDAEREELEVVLRLTDGADDPRQPRRYPLGDIGLMSVVLATSRPVRTDDYAAECARHGVEPIQGAAELRYWLGVPMTAGEQVLGVIVLRGGPRPFRAADERLLLNIGHLAALALRSVRLFEERTRAYGELAAAQDQLVRTEKLRALGEMASGVAHDFNNLLASVLGRAQLLMRRVQDPQQLQWLRVIERSALDGAQTVRRLQEFTRIRRDQPMVPLDVTQLVRDALDITQSRWREEPVSRGVVIEVRSELAPVPPILGDAAELREALTNLILNAVDAMPTGGTLGLVTTAGDDHVEIAVSDTGVGIPPAVREKIFDPFFTTKGPHGTGLGLSLTYGIVARHGGSVSVDSEEGRGSTFRLSFPSAATVETPTPASVRTAATAPRTLRCLVVDDEEPVRTVLADVIESAGHHATMVGDGAEAIERFRAEAFDVVLTDLAMPRVSGWQVARVVKQVAPRVPVVLVTGFGVELTPEERRTHGVDHVLVKPLQIQEILDALAEVARNAAPSARPEDER
jgi:GAF domain-containing protein/ActR/RegA family two-component response regulator